MNPKKYILLVDDDPLLAKLYETTLKSANFDICTVSNGEAALVEIDKRKPDLILLDIMMPKMGGIEVLKRLKNSDSNKDILVIVLTNMGRDTEEAKTARDLGVNAHLIKSETSLKELVSKASSLLEK